MNIFLSLINTFGENCELDKEREKNDAVCVQSGQISLDNEITNMNKNLKSLGDEIDHIRGQRSSASSSAKWWAIGEIAATILLSCVGAGFAARGATLAMNAAKTANTISRAATVYRFASVATTVLAGATCAGFSILSSAQINDIDNPAKAMGDVSASGSFIGVKEATIENINNKKLLPDIRSSEENTDISQKLIEQMGEAERGSR